MTPRISDERRTAQRQRILDAAMRCFERAGLDGASMQDVIAESGMSAGAIYRYFDSKDAIVEAVAIQRHEHDRDLLANAIGQDDIAAAVRAFVDTYFDWIITPEEARRRRVTVHVWAHAQHNERLRRIVAEGLNPLHDVAAALAAAQRDQRFPAQLDPTAFVQVLIALIQGFILQRSWDPDLDPAPYRATVLALLDSSLAPSPRRDAATDPPGRA